MAVETSTTRASDADRERTAAVLSEHAGQGRLSIDEVDKRMTASYAARTRGDLEGLLADLPPLQRERTPREGYDLRSRWIGWAATGVLCLLIWVSTSLASADWIYFWPIWVFGPWGLILLAKTVGVRAGLPVPRCGEDMRAGHNAGCG